MIISAKPPYFAPYPGFFHQAYLSEVLVLLDEVQFPRRTTWLSRNRFKNDQGELWLTIPVWKKGLGLQAISRVTICREGRWPRKHLESLKVAYRHAPYLKEHLSFVEEMFSPRFVRLVDLNLAVIHYLLDCLGLSTKVVRQSELGVQGQGTSLLVKICQVLGASTLLVQRPVQKYLDAELLAAQGIKLSAYHYTPPVYPQLWGEFIANLSTFDLVFNCGPKARDLLIQAQAGVA